MDASSIIDACGGTGAVAKALGAPASTVLYWGRRDSIPADRWSDLVRLAQANGRRGDITLEVLAAHRASRLSRAPAVAA